MATASFAPNDLLVGDYPVATRTVTYLAGALYVRGTVLGEITASKKVTTSLSAAGDGSEVPRLVAAYDVDATGGDVVAQAYASGGFDASKMTFGTGHTATTVEAAFRKDGAPLYVRTLA